MQTTTPLKQYSPKRKDEPTNYLWNRLQYAKKKTDLLSGNTNSAVLMVPDIAGDNEYFHQQKSDMAVITAGCACVPNPGLQ